MTSRLVLGTAQLGSHYGISNVSGKPDIKTAKEIVKTAWENGIRWFDTAQAYGDSECILGRAFNDLGLCKDVRIISKFNPSLDHLNELEMSVSLDKSLENLGVDSIYGMMLHDEHKLSLWNEGLYSILHTLVSSERVKRIGVSVYSPEKAVFALTNKFIDMIQIPTNIFDRRFEQAKVYELARNNNVDLYVRSVFLQGLILMDLKDIPSEMKHVAPLLQKVIKLAEHYHLDRRALALGYIREEMPNAYVVFGAETPEQVEQNTQAWKTEMPTEIRKKIKDFFSDTDDRIVNPVLWNRN